MRTLRLPLLAILAAALLALGLAGPALAAPVTGTPAASCVVSLRADTGHAERPATRCFDDLASAVAYATHGTVHISPYSNTLSQRQLDGGQRTAGTKRASRSGLIIGIEYKDRHYQGASKVYDVNASSCSSGGSYSDPDLSDDPLNDEISSARSYQGCVARHYQSDHFSGFHHDCGCSGMGLMNDRTSSIRWS